MLSKERQIVNGFGVFLRNIFQLPYYCTVKVLESQGLSAFFHFFSGAVLRGDTLPLMLGTQRY
jgi:hypothetical protein